MVSYGQKAEWIRLQLNVNILDVYRLRSFKHFHLYSGFRFLMQTEDILPTGFIPVIAPIKPVNPVITQTVFPLRWKLKLRISGRSASDNAQVLFATSHLKIKRKKFEACMSSGCRWHVHSRQAVILNQKCRAIHDIKVIAC